MDHNHFSQGSIVFVTFFIAGKGGSIRQHCKGCNCKRSGCLKNYCECYEVSTFYSLRLCFCDAFRVGHHEAARVLRVCTPKKFQLVLPHQFLNQTVMSRKLIISEFRESKFCRFGSLTPTLFNFGGRKKCCVVNNNI